MEDDDADAIKFFEVMLDDRPLAVHEAGHAVVAHCLGADVAFIEIDLLTGNGGSRSCTFDDEQIKNLAVIVAGCRAEHLFDARAPRKTKRGDFRKMRELLASLPEAERRFARAAGYRLADETLKENADAVRRVAEELLARESNADD